MAEEFVFPHMSITEGSPTFGAHVTDAEYQGSPAEPSSDATGD